MPYSAPSTRQVGRAELVLQARVEHAAEDGGGDRRQDRVVARRVPSPAKPGGSVPARNEPGAPKETSSARRPSRRDRPRRAVDQDPPAARLDLRLEPVEQRLPAAARIAELLTAGLAPVDPAPQVELVVQPGRRDLLGAAARTCPPSAGPRRPATPPAPSSARPARARSCRSKRSLPPRLRWIASAPAPIRSRPSSDIGLNRSRSSGRGERVRVAVAEDRHARGQPLDLGAHPELLVEGDDLPVGREEVVVVVLEPVAALDRHRRDLAAEPGPALAEIHVVAELRQPARRASGRRRRPRSRRPSPAVGVRPARPRPPLARRRPRHRRPARPRAHTAAGP